MSRSLDALIRKHHLTRHREAIGALAGPGLRLRASTAKSRLRAGASKFGGDPDVPAGFKWPMRRSKPLYFIAQINMDDVKLDRLAKWPATGSLLFFYAAEEQPWGFDPRDRDASRIVYVPEGKVRKRMARPRVRRGDDEPVIKERIVTLSKRITLPPPGNPAIVSVLVDQKDQERYWALCEELFPAFDDGEHQFLGWPQVVQNDMEVECQLAFHGFNTGDEKDPLETSPQAQAYASSAARWQLMLQVAHDDDLGVMWGDMGRLYFFATAEARASLRFDETWTILQCS